MKVGWNSQDHTQLAIVCESEEEAKFLWHLFSNGNGCSFTDYCADNHYHIPHDLKYQFWDNINKVYKPPEYQ